MQFLSTFISLLLFLANAFFELTPSFERFFGDFWFKNCRNEKVKEKRISTLPNIPGKVMKNRSNEICPNEIPCMYI